MIRAMRRSAVWPLGLCLLLALTGITNEVGNYTLRNVPVGTYRVSVVLTGFREAVVERVSITAGTVTRENVTLRIGELTESIIDGAASVNIWLPHHSAYVPPSETIEVVDISTNAFDAEKGFAGGAAITVITRSGTNDFRGSAFHYHENNALNARNFFNWIDTSGDGKADTPAGNRNIGGFTIGGPIVKDRLFFFGGWEGTFERNAHTRIARVPTAEMRAGDFSAWLPANPTDPTSCPAGVGCSMIASGVSLVGWTPK